jgi:hypothetical protein
MVVAEIGLVLLVSAGLTLALQAGIAGLRPVVSQFLLSRGAGGGAR